MNIPTHYSKADAEWLSSALAKLPGLSLPYWCSPDREALIVAAVPYRGVYDAGRLGFAAALTLECYRGADQVLTVPTVLEAREVARLTGEPLPEGSRWMMDQSKAEAAFDEITRSACKPARPPAPHILKAQRRNFEKLFLKNS